MDSDEKTQSTQIGGNVNGGIIANGNDIEINVTRQMARKPSNDRGAFMPMVRNALFTGREDALTALTQAMMNSETNVVITQAITGMGGLGKSQLALEFAYRSIEAGDFVSAHWLNLMDPAQINGEIARCGREMGLFDESVRQLPEMLAETLRVWAKRGPRLLVLDNYEAAADAMQTLAPLLALPTLRLLITARRADFPPELGLQTYPLTVFTPTESVQFVRKLVRLKASETPNIKKLAETLGHLPLALHLVGHYLLKEDITPGEYLSELDQILAHESMQAAWFGQMNIKSPTQHEQSLLGTFALSWQKVTDETAQTIFKLAGYLAPNEPIPLEIFEKTIFDDTKDDHSILDNSATVLPNIELSNISSSNIASAKRPRILRKAINHLKNIGLFTTKNDLPTIHTLLAAYARHLDSTPSPLLERLADKLRSLATQANEKVDQSSNLRWFTPLQVHVQATAEHAEKAGLQVAANLYGNLGYYLKKLADYAAGQTINKHARRILQNHLESEVKTQSNLLAAQDAFERALKIDEAAFGENHPIVATHINNLGMVLKDLGNFSAARDAFERALKIDEATFGKDHPIVAIRVSNLGMVLKDLGNLSTAKTCFERALHIFEENFGENHSDVATLSNNLGLLMQDLGDLSAARNSFERALKIDEATFGKDHPYIARDINNLGSVLNALGDLAAARDTFERALKIDEAAFGKDHPNVAIRVNNLGSVLKALGDLAAARDAFERALKIDEAAFGKEHPNVAIRILNLGTVLQAQGEPMQARACYERALTIFERFLPAGHPNIEIVKGWLRSLDEAA